MIKFEREELDAWKSYGLDYFLDVLNGETPIEEARENLQSFRNSEFYTGTNEEYKKIKE
jgi:hypothetical protein